MDSDIGECIRTDFAHTWNIRSQNMPYTLVIAEHVDHLTRDNGDRHGSLLNQLFLTGCRINGGLASFSQFLDHIDKAYGVLK